MNLAVKYTNNRGQSIEFGGADKALNLFEGKLRDSEWKYEAGSSYAAPYFYREPDEVTLKVGVAAATEEEGLAWRDRWTWRRCGRFREGAGVECPGAALGGFGDGPAGRHHGVVPSLRYQ